MRDSLYSETCPDVPKASDMIILLEWEQFVAPLTARRAVFRILDLKFKHILFQ